MAIHRLYHPSGHFMDLDGKRFDLCVMSAKHADLTPTDSFLFSRPTDFRVCFDHVAEQRDEKIVIGYSSRSVVGDALVSAGAIRDAALRP